MNAERERRGLRSALSFVAVCAAVALGGCAATQQAAVNPSAARTGLVDYSRLSPGGQGQSDLRWVNPAANWRQYKKVLINPVTFWADQDDAGIPAADQQALCDYLHQALYQQFSQQFQIADKPGPGVLRLQVAIVDAKAATPGLRSISMLEPHVRAVATLKYLATGTYPFVGGAEVATRLSDSQTGMILGEFVDRRIGGGAVKTGLQWEWGDAENALNREAANRAAKVVAWTSGAATP